MIFLDNPIERVPKISKKIVPALKRLGIKTVRDLLFHFPARYDDFSNVRTIREVGHGETITVMGVIERIANFRTVRKRMTITEARVKDATGTIAAVWFNQAFLTRNLKAGDTVNLSGKVALGKKGLYLQSPAYEKLSRINLDSYYRSLSSGIHTGGLVAVYPETKGITSRWLRFLIKTCIDFRKNIIDPLPRDFLKKYELPDIREALLAIHFPKTRNGADAARRRFAFDELLIIQLHAFNDRLKLKQESAPVIPQDIPLIKEFVRSLPFSLTDAQRRSLWEVIQDIAKSTPMNRLLNGDVGSGKTVVAAAASLSALRVGFRVIFMAPTEILARQHFDTFEKLLLPFNVKIGLMVGSEKRSIREADIVIGTHALIQKNVRLGNLGMVIIDEQHRFGVGQRAALTKNQELVPHFLSMTATPIPRTLTLTVYGDLDISLLDEMPKNRRSVITKIVEPGRREETYRFVRNEVSRGRQVFVICPRIEKSMDTPTSDLNDKKIRPREIAADVKTVKEEYKKLSEDIFPDLKIAMLHGKMKSKEKDAVMRRFKNRELDILVSTSVVEVGVDIPNATIMMIEGAERFGLAQLHQFRGRVGRGNEQSYCFLFTTEDGMVTRRLRAVVEVRNGFELAEKDLEIRGPGDFLGTRQSGIPDAAFTSLTDMKLIRSTREAAKEILSNDPELKKYPAFAEKLSDFEKQIHLE